MVRAGGNLDVYLEDTTPKDVEITGDRIQIQQVVINLLRNACDAVAVSDPCSVTVGMSRREGQIVVSVSDTGPGVSYEAAQSIFAWSGSSKAEGLGLGLSISRTIIEAHHGTIWLESTSSSGSTFCFSLPYQGAGSSILQVTAHGSA